MMTQEGTIVSKISSKDFKGKSWLKIKPWTKAHKSTKRIKIK
jgi:hypothetical protein